MENKKYKLPENNEPGAIKSITFTLPKNDANVLERIIKHGTPAIYDTNTGVMTDLTTGISSAPGLGFKIK